MYLYQKSKNAIIILLCVKDLVDRSKGGEKWTLIEVFYFLRISIFKSRQP
jgi:hypothetical protein